MTVIPLFPTVDFDPIFLVFQKIGAKWQSRCRAPPGNTFLPRSKEPVACCHEHPPRPLLEMCWELCCPTLSSEANCCARSCRGSMMFCTESLHVGVGLFDNRKSYRLHHGWCPGTFGKEATSPL